MWKEKAEVLEGKVNLGNMKLREYTDELDKKMNIIMEKEKEIERLNNENKKLIIEINRFKESPSARLPQTDEYINERMREYNESYVIPGTNRTDYKAERQQSALKTMHSPNVIYQLIIVWQIIYYKTNFRGKYGISRKNISSEV